MAPLAILLIIVIMVWFWQVSQQCRDLAVAVARQTCNNQNLQFLDGTATLEKIRLCLSGTNGPGFKRIYTFDYSEDGIGRRSGCIIMHNTRVSSVLLDSQ